MWTGGRSRRAAETPPLRTARTRSRRCPAPSVTGSCRFPPGCVGRPTPSEHQESGDNLTCRGDATSAHPSLGPAWGRERGRRRSCHPVYLFAKQGPEYRSGAPREATGFPQPGGQAWPRVDGGLQPAYTAERWPVRTTPRRGQEPPCSGGTGPGTERTGGHATARSHPTPHPGQPSLAPNARSQRPGPVARCRTRTRPDEMSPDEAHLPAEEPSPQAQARLPAPDAHTCWAGRGEPAAREGASAADGLSAWTPTIPRERGDSATPRGAAAVCARGAR